MSQIIQPWSRGRITGWAGNMGSDKTTLLVAKALDTRKHRAGIAAYQPLRAVRDPLRPDEIRARNGLLLKDVVAYDQPEEILHNFSLRKAKNIFLDEIQFNDMDPGKHLDFKNVVRQLLEADCHIYWAGLPRDFLGETFEIVGWMIGITPTDAMYLLQAECDVCLKRPADLPQRLRHGQPVSQNDDRFVTDDGTAGVTYEARCKNCHQVALVQEFVPPAS